MLRSKIIFALVVSTATPALVTSTRGAAAEEKTKLDVEALLAEVRSGDRARMLAAIEAVEDAKDPAGAPVLELVLSRGATAEVLAAALEAAGKIRVESTSALIAPYVRHRTASIRRAAAKALLKTGGPAAVKALTDGLRSGDAIVRGLAATGLGTLKARESLPDLFLAFDHGVAEAAASIGLLCEPEECERFASMTGKKPFDIMVSGFDQILFRPPKDMPDEQKIRLVGRMRELGTADVGKYLADVADRWPKGWSKKVKQALEAAAKAAGGS
jgi:hypothetical protein